MFLLHQGFFTSAFSKGQGFLCRGFQGQIPPWLQTFPGGAGAGSAAPEIRGRREQGEVQPSVIKSPKDGAREGWLNRLCSDTSKPTSLDAL